MDHSLARIFPLKFTFKILEFLILQLLLTVIIKLQETNMHSKMVVNCKPMKFLNNIGKIEIRDVKISN